MTDKLETEIAHLTKTVDELSDVVARQDSEIIRLTRLVDELTRREAARDADGSGGAVFGDERPPHW